MNDYKKHSRKTDEAAERHAPPPLSEAEKLAIAQRVNLVKKHIPEAMDFIKDLHALGMVDGLRCITSVTTPDGVKYGNP